MNNRKNNQIHFYCSWILPYILSKAIIFEQSWGDDIYLIEDVQKAMSLLNKLEQKMNIDDKFIKEYSQFCVYISAIRHKIHTTMELVEKINEEFKEGEPLVFSLQDLTLIDRLLELLYDIYRKLEKLDKNENFLFSAVDKFPSSREILSNDYEIILNFKE